MKKSKNLMTIVILLATVLLTACKAEYSDCTPTEGMGCDTVHFTIHGHYFGQTTVYFNGTESPHVFDSIDPADSKKKLFAVVPGRASTGPIRINNNTGMGWVIGMLSSDTTFADDFVILGPTLPVPPLGFRSTPEVINPGETAVLSWVMPPYITLTGLTINGGEIVNLDVLHLASSAVEVRPDETTTYELIKELDCMSETESVTVTVRN